jgi:hypothetical protein
VTHPPPIGLTGRASDAALVVAARADPDVMHPPGPPIARTRLVEEPI